MNTSKILRAVVGSGRYTETAAITKEDYGIILKIEGIELPETYEIDFSNDRKEGTSVTMMKTTYIFHIPNRVRPDRTNEQPEPEQQSVIDQTIAALNDAVETTSKSASDAAESAGAAEQSAENAAESASQSAESASQASASATSAAQSAQQASASASMANAAATSASASASSAATSAERAEQSAAQSGYLWFYIENGKLYMDRTPNTKVNFYMENGKLYVEEVN